MVNNDYIDFSKNTLSANQLIQKIINLADKSSNIGINWQNTGNQLIVQTKNYFYKIYKTSYSNIYFFIIRNELGKIYREQYNLLWDIYTIKQQDAIYEFQLRQKIHAFSSQQITFTSILQNWKYTQNILQKNLKFNILSKQLKLNIQLNNLSKIILLRDQINKNNDYGIYKNHIILLDDSDFFIGLLDKNNNLLQKEFNFYDCSSIGDGFILSKYQLDFFKDTYLNQSFKFNKWMIYNSTYLMNRQLNTEIYSTNQENLIKAIKYIGKINDK